MKSKLMLVYKKLLNKYGEQGWWPILKQNSFEYRTFFKHEKKSINQKFEICIGAILTQNTAWKNVEKAFVNLSRANIFSPQKILSTPEKKLAELIRPAGYYNVKTRKLKEISRFFLEHKDDFENESLSREELLRVWGVGKESADYIMLYALNKPFFVIDAYTIRIFSRLGFFDEKSNYDFVQEFFQKNLAKDYKIYNEYHALIVEHAKNCCRKKPVCEDCVLRKECKYYQDKRDKNASKEQSKKIKERK
ncbi:MAG: endonuclease III domain-containing protein [Candidatus Woesearchaeota archaeon]